MGLNSYGIAALAGAAALLVGGGAALAGSGDGGRGALCEARLAKLAERRGVSAEQLTADLRSRLLARIDAAETEGRISPGRATQLRERVSEGSLCGGRKVMHARVAAHGMVRAAADFLGLSREQLRAQIPGTSLAGLAAKQGKSVDALTAAMLAPAKERLARAVAAGRITQAQADAALERLARAADRLATRVVPTT